MSDDPFALKPSDEAPEPDHTDSMEYAGFTKPPFYLETTQVQVPHSTYVRVDDPPCGEGLSTSRCKTLHITIPGNGTVDAVRLYCKEDEQRTWSPCAPYDRPLGWSRFGQPWQEMTPAGRVVKVIFKNWSGDRNRDARMDVAWR